MIAKRMANVTFTFLTFRGLEDERTFLILSCTVYVCVCMVLPTLEPFLLYTFFHFSIEINMYSVHSKPPIPHRQSQGYVSQRYWIKNTVRASMNLHFSYIHVYTHSSHHWNYFFVLWLLLLHACFIFGQSTANIPIFKGKTCSQQIHLGKRSYEWKKLESNPHKHTQIGGYKHEFPSKKLSW